MNKMILTAALAASVTALPALADGGKHGRKGSDYAQVISAEPIYRSVRVSEPSRECREERVVLRDRPEYWMDNGTGGAFIGAIAGGVAGHQFGKGRGKDAATALGALIGAGIGQRVALENSARPVERVVYEERCDVVERYRYEERVEGYDVAYRYNGRIYHTRMPYDPGKRIPVSVDVRPASF